MASLRTKPLEEEILQLALNISAPWSLHGMCCKISKQLLAYKMYIYTIFPVLSWIACILMLVLIMQSWSQVFCFQEQHGIHSKISCTMVCKEGHLPDWKPLVNRLEASYCMEWNCLHTFEPLSSFRSSVAAQPANAWLLQNASSNVQSKQHSCNHEIPDCLHETSKKADQAGRTHFGEWSSSGNGYRSQQIIPLAL